MTTNTRKAKRKLSDISFDAEGAHVALVAKEQGGPANGHDYALVMKANNFSQEFIQKVQQVQVTMELPEFLQRFFHLYHEDAEVLARMFGYVEPEEEVETESYEDWYENRIQERLDSYVLLKSLKDAKSLPEAMSKLTEDQYLSVLKAQEIFEKGLKESTKVEKSAEGDTSIAGEVKQEEVSTSVNQQELEKSMAKEDTKQPEIQVEMVEKSALTTLQKAFDEQKVALEKAMETIAAFEAEKKAAIEKARKEELVKAVKDEAKAEVLFKALKDVSDEDFTASVKALGELAAAQDASDLFVEKGATVDEAPVVQESAVAKLLKAKQVKQATK